MQTLQWESLPTMSEGRDLRNKVCFVDGYAYAMGGLNSKAERLNYTERKWEEVPCYPLSDNLDSWASCMLFTPKLFANKECSLAEGLSILGSNEGSTRTSDVSGASGASGTNKAALISVQKQLEDAEKLYSERLQGSNNARDRRVARRISAAKDFEGKKANIVEAERLIDEELESEIERNLFNTELVQILRTPVVADEILAHHFDEDFSEASTAGRRASPRPGASLNIAQVDSQAQAHEDFSGLPESASALMRMEAQTQNNSDLYFAGGSMSSHEMGQMASGEAARGESSMDQQDSSRYNLMAHDANLDQPFPQPSNFSNYPPHPHTQNERNLNI